MSQLVDEVPFEPIAAQLAREIDAGADPEQAAKRVLAPYQGAPLAVRAWPVVLDDARRMVRERARRVEDAAFSAGDRAQRRVREAVEKVRRASFTVRPGGPEVVWEESTRADHAARVAWQRLTIAGIEEDVRRHLRAIEVMEEHGVDRLGDVPDWADLLVDGASGPVTASV